LTAADEIMGEARWRSRALPPMSTEENAPRTRASSVNVTTLETEGLRRWSVPYRDRLDPEAPIEFRPDKVVWFESDLPRSLEIDSIRAEVVKVSDDSKIRCCGRNRQSLSTVRARRNGRGRSSRS